MASSRIRICACCACAMRRSSSMSCSRSRSTTLSLDHIARSETRAFRSSAIGDSERRSSSVQPSMKSASSLCVSLHDLTVVAPQLREAAALEPLLEDAEPGAVPEQHLAELARLVHEQEQVAAHRIGLEPALHEAVQAVVAFAQIRSAPDTRTRAQRDWASGSSEQPQQADRLIQASAPRCDSHPAPRTRSSVRTGSRRHGSRQARARSIRFPAEYRLRHNGRRNALFLLAPLQQPLQRDTECLHPLDLAPASVDSPLDPRQHTLTKRLGVLPPGPLRSD